ncbi:putative adenylyl-sulfate kinase [bacterium BMS3Bbin08]|nr:putative adenylyl-sulfate kinase [bacterium BMS3Bbin08]
MSAKKNHVVWHDKYVQRSDRNRFNRHKSCVIWFTGLSAAGKSTIAHNVEQALFKRGVQIYTLDGDNVRHGLNVNLGFSPEDRKENLRNKKARAGIIKNYTGVSDPYEEPENPELVIDTEKNDVESSTRLVLELLDKKKFLYPADK